ncbi:hypothetical protein QR680_016595 [Steinernema hermaphroditum]|uniref:CULT domain-containing protein n=1 Tax=Steinernema hermaphroditum TaxID=289476 RepID=A0AA39HDN4_9BILA|nr:hypothetical protein QR680_016595 [Steinernema hermaphroditum]
MFRHLLLLVFLLSVPLLVFGKHEFHVNPSGDLICRRCGHVITKAVAVRRVTTPNAVFAYNMSIVGVDTTINVLDNPAGYRFHVMAVNGADLKFQGDYHSSDTWFPGYKWIICTCKTCNQHAGWYFQLENQPESPKNFVGIVLDSVISADAAEDLLKLPAW